MRKYQINFLSVKKPLIIEAESFKDALESSIKRGKDLKYANLSGANLEGAKLEGANLLYADLSYADLSYAKLSYANLSGAKLEGANLEGAKLSGAKLLYADLSYAKLEGANLEGAKLSGAKLEGAKLSYANLSYADLDYSSWPLWCGSLSVKIDKRIFCQLLYHTLRAGQSVEDEEVQALLNNPDVLKLANQFHRVEECGKLEPRQGEVKR